MRICEECGDETTVRYIDSNHLPEMQEGLGPVCRTCAEDILDGQVRIVTYTIGPLNAYSIWSRA